MPQTEMNFFVNLYTPRDADRAKEIEYCWQKNQQNKFFKNIIIVNRDRPATFGDFFRAMSDYPDDVNIMANTDIYFDDTIEAAGGIKKTEAYCLTRWEDMRGRIVPFEQRHGRRAPSRWSQDAWIFRGHPIPNHFDHVFAVNTVSRRSERVPFYLGTRGCDNKMAAMLKDFRYTVKNPCLSIRAIHVHMMDHRQYSDYQILRGIRPYGLVEPSGL